MCISETADIEAYVQTRQYPLLLYCCSTHWQPQECLGPREMPPLTNGLHETGCALEAGILIVGGL